MDRMDFELEQYRSLRAEILRSMEDGNQIMGFGLAAIGLVLNAGLNVQATLFGFLIFAVLVPCLSSLVLSMWFAAQERTARASHFLSGFERRIKNFTGMENTALWESWLRTKRDNQQSNHFWHTEVAGIGLLSLLMGVPLYFSLSIGGPHLHIPVRVSVVSVVTMYIVLFLLNMRKRFRNWQRWLSTSPSTEQPG